MKFSDDYRRMVKKNVATAGQDLAFVGMTNIWLRQAIQYNYAHNFYWLGRPIIQVPQDIYAVQELVWEIKPDLIVETGIALGGSLVLSASMLALLDYCEAIENGTVLDPKNSNRKVIGIDIDIREHNRKAIEEHPLYHLIEMIEDSSVSENAVEKVYRYAESYKKILIFLDSNHTHDHVLRELQLYAPLTTSGSYCVVWDTGIEDLPDGFCDDRPWGKGNNPMTAVFEYLEKLKLDSKNDLFFEIDKDIENKLLITAGRNGFLKRIK